jgi:hypothetical protein
MEIDRREILARAAGYWEGGRALDAGELIFESLPAETRPIWAAGILRLVHESGGRNCFAIQVVLEIADDPTEWASARGAFLKLRKETLRLERSWFSSRKQRLLLLQLYVAENVAKVLYNATNPADEFDGDSGWWIAKCLRDFVEMCDDQELSKAATRTLLSGSIDAT